MHETGSNKDIELFNDHIAGLTNKPVIIHVNQLLDTVQHLHYEWHIDWSSSLRTFASAGQFFHASLVPFFGIDTNDLTKTLSPKLVQTPGCVIPELSIKYRDKDCYIGTFHVSEHIIRLVIAQIYSGFIETEMKSIIIDLECENSTFCDLLELKSLSGADAFDKYADYMDIIEFAKQEKYGGDDRSFRVWLESIDQKDREWLDFYVS